MSMSKREAVALITVTILEAVKAAGPLGAPGGHLYAAMMGSCTLAQFQRFMAALVQAGVLRKEGQVYFAA